MPDEQILQITFLIKNNCIKNIMFDINETDMPSSSETIEKIALTLLKIIKLDKGDLKVQDVLNELNIKRE